MNVLQSDTMNWVADTIRLGHALEVLRPTLHNGPGWRIGLWTQGCVHRCTDQCLSPHLLDPTRGTVFSVPDVARSVIECAARAPQQVEGVTILGGEPFEQAAAVAALLRLTREHGLSHMVYSGHTYQHLLSLANPEIADLLAQTDILVDGPYLPHLYSDTLAWRGSTNQRLLCLTDWYTPESLEHAFARQGKGFSLLIGRGRVSISGMQNRDSAAVVEKLLHAVKSS